MIVSREELLSRFFKIGSGATAIGAIHILALLLSWYIEANSETAIYGYLFSESLILSVVGGLFAGIGLIAAYFAKVLKSMKLLLGGFTITGGILATLSPIYVYAVKLLGLSINARLDIGFFAAAFTGVLQVGMGLLALLTPIKEEVVPTLPTVAPPVAPMPPPITEATRPGGAVTAKILPAPDLEEAVCSICFEPIQVGEAVRCSNCEAVFHDGCVDTWVSVNGTCPSCKAIVVD
ncbi:MAG: hypothetical protein N3F65_02435 [Nitrososphaeria archaeon]|nr:hypothetical protein [Aigarchaeota archaeon]MCX8187451.1 hypothetical protein [Nitrososphaeria archaeon]MDW8021089.1 RING finger domain-containing protein [Nitrososphaerota archaeon]